MYINIYLSIHMCVGTLYILIYNNLVIELFMYKTYYTYTYKIELYQQVSIYNEQIQCTSHTSCVQVLELPQSHFGNNQEGTLFSLLHVLCSSCFCEI